MRFRREAVLCKGYSRRAPEISRSHRADQSEARNPLGETFEWGMTAPCHETTLAYRRSELVQEKAIGELLGTVEANASGAGAASEKKSQLQQSKQKGDRIERQSDVPVRSRIRERRRRQGRSRGAEGAPPRACRRHLRRSRPHQKRRRQSQDSRQDREADPTRWLGWFGCRCSDWRDLSSVYPGQRAGGCWGWRPHRPSPGRDVQL